MSPAAWRLLALALGPPDAARLEQVELLADALGVEELALPADPEGAAGDFDRLLGVDALCPPREGSYEADPFRQARQLADVSGFYLAFGSEASGPAAERADHAGCELEFLSFLGLRRLAALEAGDEAAAETCRLTEDAFLRDHAGRWLPGFFASLAGQAQAPLYRSVGKAGFRLLSEELAGRGIVPEPLRPRRALAVEADCLTCGAA